jgi:hypothetical protein
MPIASGMGMRLYLQGLDLSGDVGAIGTIRQSAAALDVTPISASAMQRILALRDGEITFNCFFNDNSAANRAAATGTSFLALSALPTTDVLALVLRGTTRGDATWALSAKQVNYDWQRGADGSLMGTVQLIGAAGFALEPGALLVAKSTHASATDETGLDQTAQTTSGAVGFLQHFSAASGTVEYDIEDSSDNVSFTNLLAFSDVVTPWAATAQRVAVNGTVERYVRASTNGTFTTAVFSMALRRRGSGDYDAA